MESLYDILGVSHDATEEEIKNAYYLKAKEHHPDVNSDDNAKELMQKINEAYRILSDAIRRKTYDETGSTLDIDLIKEKIESLIKNIISQVALSDNDIHTSSQKISSFRTAWTKDHSEGVNKMKKTRNKLIKFKESIRSRPDDDIVTKFIDKEIKAIDEHLETIEIDWQCRLRAFEILEQYSFRDSLCLNYVVKPFSFTINATGIK